MESASTMDLHVTEEEELRFPDWTKVDWMTKDASFWTESSEDIISMKRQSLTDLKLHQSKIQPMSFGHCFLLFVKIL